MADNINSMMSTGNKIPWHGRGKVLGEEAIDSETAIKAAGLDWNVNLHELITRSGIPLAENYASVREDTNEVLGVVGKRYTVLQNRDAFKIFDGIVGDGHAIYHTAGALGKGERVWILAKLPGHVVVKGDDVVDKYLLLSTSHDGSSSLQMLFTPIRVVCQNTLNVAIKTAEEGQRVRAKHTIDLPTKASAMGEALGIINRKYNVFEQAAKALANRNVTVGGVNSYLNDLVGLDPTKIDQQTKKKNIVDTIRSYYEHGAGNDQAAVRGTAWALFNGVVEYVDYARSTKGDDKEASRHMASLFGTGQIMKQKAYEMALQLV